MKNSIFTNFLTGYEKSDEDLKESRVKRLLDKTFAKISISGVNSSYARFCSKSKIGLFMKRLADSLSFTPSRTWGVLLLAFGFMTLIINFAFGYFRDFSETATEVFPLVAGALVAIVGVFLSFTGKPLCHALQEFSLTDYIFFEFLRIKRSGRAPKDLHVFHPVAFLLLGAFLGVLGFFISTEIVLLAVAAVIFVAVSMASPEFTFLSTLLALPYLQLLSHPTVALSALVLLCTVSYTRKVALGKRIFSFEQYDIILLLFAVFILISGIFNGGLRSFESASVLLILTLGYIPASNLITNRRLADCAFNAVIVSSVPPSLLAVFEYTLGIAEFKYMDESFAGVISGRSTATFGNPNVLAVYLIVTVIFSFGYALERRDGWKKAVYFAVFAINLTALIFTWSRGAWIAVAAALLIFLVMRLRRHAGLLTVILALIPYAVFILPESIMLRITSVFDTHDTSSSYRLSIYRSSLNMLGENLFGGVGIGTDAFSDAFLAYAESGVVAPHSHNLFLEIACEAGIFALVLFAVLLLVRLRHHASYLPYVKNSSVSALTSIVGVTVFALVLFGMTDYVFYDASMYFTFFSVFGIGSALYRIAKREHDDRVCYYSDMDNNASAIDVELDPNCK